MKTDLGFSDSNCPLCGEVNQCAMSAGNEISDCWCRGVKIDAEALKAIPTEFQGKVCICKTCATPEEPLSDR